MQHFFFLPDPDISNLGVIISTIKQTKKKHTKNCIVCFQMVSIYNQEKVETLSPNLLSLVGARMFSKTDFGEIQFSGFISYTVSENSGY